MTVFFQPSLVALSDTLLGQDKAFHLEHLKSGLLPEISSRSYRDLSNLTSQKLAEILA